VSDPGLADKVVLLHDALDNARIAHAFGGALALAYYGEPRATVDIDINVFLGADAFDAVLDVLAPFDISRAPSPAIVARDGQARVWWGANPVDLFFSYDAVHDAMRAQARVVPFGDRQIQVLAPEHLVVAKVAFDRAKDWLDIEQVLVITSGLDLDEIRRWLRHLMSVDDPRVVRYDELVARLR
jgi:hypothetical protein